MIRNPKCDYAVSYSQFPCWIFTCLTICASLPEKTVSRAFLKNIIWNQCLMFNDTLKQLWLKQINNLKKCFLWQTLYKCKNTGSNVQLQLKKGSIWNQYRKLIQRSFLELKSAGHLTRGRNLDILTVKLHKMIGL